MMRTKFNKNGTVSILQLPMAAYDAICNVLMSSEQTFEREESAGQYWANSDFVCALEKEEKEAMDEINWML